MAKKKKSAKPAKAKSPSRKAATAARKSNGVNLLDDSESTSRIKRGRFEFPDATNVRILHSVARHSLAMQSPNLLPFAEDPAVQPADERGLAAPRIGMFRQLGPVLEQWKVADTTVFPWCSVCSITSDFPSGSAIGTGWLIGQGVVVTAGHVVYDHRLGGHARKVKVIPGLNGSKAPFGVRFATALRWTDAWERNASEELDYGVILLQDGLKWTNQDKLKYFEPRVLSTSQLRSYTGVTLAGYPQNQPTTLCWDTDTLDYVLDGRILYSNDTLPGNSGGPVWIRENDDTRFAVGIHNYYSSQYGRNQATRITQRVYDELMGWAAEI